MDNIKLTGTIMKSEQRFTPKGNMVLNLGVSMYTGGNKEDGYKKSAWVNVTVWDNEDNKLASAWESLTKGDRITVSGMVNEPRFYKRDGVDYPAGLEVTAHSICRGDDFKEQEQEF